MSARQGTLAAVTIGAALALASCTAAPQAPAPVATPAPETSAPVAATVSAKLSGAATTLQALNNVESVAIGFADGQVAVWNGRDPAPSVVLKPHTARVLAIASSRDGREIWSLAEDGTVSRTAVAAGAPSMTITKIDLGTAPTRMASFGDDAAWLVTGGEFGDLRVFDLPSGGLRHELHGHRTEIQALSVRPGSPIIASTSAESDLRIWDAVKGSELHHAEGDLSLFAAAFSPRGDVLVSGGVDRRLTWRDATSWTVSGNLTLKAPRMVGGVAWSPDGRYLAMSDIDDETLSKGNVTLVDAASRAVMTTLDTGGEPQANLAVLPNGIVVGAAGPMLRSWTVPAPATTR